MGRRQRAGGPRARDAARAARRGAKSPALVCGGGVVMSPGGVAAAAALALGLTTEDAPLEDAVLEDAVRQAQAHVRSLFDGAVELAGGVSIRRPPSTAPGTQTG